MCRSLTPPSRKRCAQELRAYFAELMTPEVEAEVAARATPAARRCLEAVRQMGARRLARHRLAEGVRRPGPRRRSSSSSSSTRRGGPAPRCRSSPSTPSARRSWSSAPRSRRTSSCPRSCAGELHFSIGYTEPGAGTDLASLTTNAVQGRRRVGHQRPEDLHDARRLRRLHLARGPHRPGRAEAQGHHDLRGADDRPRVLVHEDPHDGERVSTINTFYDDVRVPATTPSSAR